MNEKEAATIAYARTIVLFRARLERISSQAGAASPLHHFTITKGA